MGMGVRRRKGGTPLYSSSPLTSLNFLFPKTPSESTSQKLNWKSGRGRESGEQRYWLIYLVCVLIQGEIKCSQVKEVKLTQGICLELNEDSSCVSQTPLRLTSVLSSSLFFHNPFWTSLSHLGLDETLVGWGEFSLVRHFSTLSFWV